MNALATGVGVSDLTCAMITGSLWFRVPETIRVVLKGRLPKGVYAKDIILYLAGLLARTVRLQAVGILRRRCCNIVG